MSATDELRKMLDERGVEWGNIRNDGSESDYLTEWQFENNRGKAIAIEWAVGSGLSVEIHRYHLTPVQAITATLGSDDTYTREDVEGAFVSGYSLGLDMFDSSKTEKGWNQNERSLDEEMDDLGWVRKDAATPGVGTCEADETDLIPFVRADSGDLDVDYIHVMECNKCGGTYEHVNGSYEFCPRCGRKVVDE